ncbi:protein SSUH2 homolog [Anneissia japonica]|uniref:protein SSUH2 homolog n=1 Tax=Anneissia japonica TaxID=1529436 RepID=UPI001425B9D5|nr:protein SSUH2 homolog [Anneissia japonica]
MYLALSWCPPQYAADAPQFNWDDVSDTADEGAEPKDANFVAVAGYEAVAFDDVPVAPPTYEPSPPEHRPEEKFESTGSIDEAAVRSAMQDFVGGHCCYGYKPANEMEFKTITPSSAFHYHIETFTEARTTKRVFLPFYGGILDGPQMGTAPLPWALPCKPDALFMDQIKMMEIPHTSEIQACYNCYARGFIRCKRCVGKGKILCPNCKGAGTKRVHHDGQMVNRCCAVCKGSGRPNCDMCNGHACVACPVCKGYKLLRYFIKLFITYTNHKTDYVHENTGLPDNLIKNVNGKLLFEQSAHQVWPVSTFPVPEVNSNSARIVDLHRSAWPNKRILQQRHNLRSIPVSEVDYTWKSVQSKFWVYGFENQVHCPKYPQSCCWGCNIL